MSRLRPPRLFFRPNRGHHREHVHRADPAEGLLCPASFRPAPDRQLDLHGAVDLSAGISGPERYLARRDEHFHLAARDRGDGALASAGHRGSHHLHDSGQTGAAFEYLLGKLAGVLLLLAVSMLVMSALFFVVLKVREQTVLERNDAADAGFAAGANGGGFGRGSRRPPSMRILLPGIGIIYVKACLLAALTLFISTFATTTIFTTVVMVFVYFIGHLQATAREYWLQANSAGWLTQSISRPRRSALSRSATLQSGG